VPCKALQCKILGAAPWFDADPANPCEISNDKRINAIILAKGIKGFLILLNLIGI